MPCGPACLFSCLSKKTTDALNTYLIKKKCCLKNWVTKFYSRYEVGMFNKLIKLSLALRIIHRKILAHSCKKLKFIVFIYFLIIQRVSFKIISESCSLGSLLVEWWLCLFIKVYAGDYGPVISRRLSSERVSVTCF